MDISQSIADATGPAVIPFSLPREYRAAYDALIPRARLRIRVFDHDLSEAGWESGARKDALTAFLRQSARARIQILLRDTRWVAAHCPRLHELRKGWGHLIDLHVCLDAALESTDPMLLIDGQHYVHRFHFEQPRGAAGVFQPEETRSLGLRFDSLWQDSEPAVPVTTLGL